MVKSVLLFLSHWSVDDEECFAFFEPLER